MNETAYDPNHFYELAAQFIPVLAIVVAVEMRMLKLKVIAQKYKSDWAVFGFFAVVYMAGQVAVGEIVAAVLMAAGLCLQAQRVLEDATPRARKGAASAASAGALFLAVQACFVLF